MNLSMAMYLGKIATPEDPMNCIWVACLHERKSSDLHDIWAEPTSTKVMIGNQEVESWRKYGK